MTSENIVFLTKYCRGPTEVPLCYVTLQRGRNVSSSSSSSRLLPARDLVLLSRLGSTHDHRQLVTFVY